MVRKKGEVLKRTALKGESGLFRVVTAWASDRSGLCHIISKEGKTIPGI